MVRQVGSAEQKGRCRVGCFCVGVKKGNPEIYHYCRRSHYPAFQKGRTFLNFHSIDAHGLSANSLALRGKSSAKKQPEVLGVGHLAKVEVGRFNDSRGPAEVTQTYQRQKKSHATLQQPGKTLVHSYMKRRSRVLIIKRPT